MLIGTKTVNAEEYSFEYKPESESSKTVYRMYLKGIEDTGSEYSYFVKFVNNESEKPGLETVPNGSYDSAGISKIKPVLFNNTGIIELEQDWYMLDGYDKAYVIKCHIEGNGRSCSIIDDYINIEKPELPSLGDKYDVLTITSEERQYVSVLYNFPFSG